jgi:hypothetical protein
VNPRRKPDELWLTILRDAETSDAQQDVKTTYEDFYTYIITTGLWVYLDGDDIKLLICHLYSMFNYH